MPQYVAFDLCFRCLLSECSITIGIKMRKYLLAILKLEMDLSSGYGFASSLGLNGLRKLSVLESHF